MGGLWKPEAQWRSTQPDGNCAICVMHFTALEGQVWGYWPGKVPSLNLAIWQYHTRIIYAQ